MKERLKGMVIGLTMGVMLAGSAVVYAAEGTSIEVYYNKLKFMIDGVEKAPAEGQPFIYEGTTYVPLRFAAESVGKPVEWDEETQTIWIGQKVANEQIIVANYNGGTISKARFDKDLAIIKWLTPSYAQYDSDPEYMEYMLKFLIGNLILSGQANDEEVKAAGKQAATQWDAVENSRPEIDKQLLKASLTVEDVKQFLRMDAIAAQVLLRYPNDAKLKELYDASMAADKGAFTVASVRHILIESNPTRSKEEALKLARETLEKLRKGDDFAQLAKQISDDGGSKSNGGLYEDVDVNQWVPQFKQAAIDLPLNVISEPVETDYGYHIIRVETRHTKGFEEQKAILREHATNNFRSFEVPSLIQNIDLSVYLK